MLLDKELVLETPKAHGHGVKVRGGSGYTSGVCLTMIADWHAREISGETVRGFNLDLLLVTHAAYRIVDKSVGEEPELPLKLKGLKKDLIDDDFGEICKIFKKIEPTERWYYRLDMSGDNGGHSIGFIVSGSDGKYLDPNIGVHYFGTAARWGQAIPWIVSEWKTNMNVEEFTLWEILPN